MLLKACKLMLVYSPVSCRDRGGSQEPREATAATEHQRGRLRRGGHPHDEKLLGRRAPGEARFPAAQGHHKEAQQVRHSHLLPSLQIPTRSTGQIFS